MGCEETRFKKGNKAAEKWTEEEALKSFNSMLEYAMNNEEVLSVQQAYIDFKMPGATYYYLTEKYPVLEAVKKQINDIIIARVNKKALKGDFNPTASIWRMKQLGERDEKHLDHTTAGEKLEPPKITFNE